MSERAQALQDIDEYWNERSTTYSASVRNELETGTREDWRDVLRESIPGFGMRQMRVLDIGCGPGFFSILCAEEGCLVDAIDFSEEMLGCAEANSRSFQNVHDRIRFHRGDVQLLPFADGMFDAIVTRNVTWNLQEPITAYTEWHRVLKHGGRLINFDANWYLYLTRPEINAQRIMDQRDRNVLRSSDAREATEEQCRRCERIALGLPLTCEERPAWDSMTLESVGFSDVSTRLDVWRKVWTQGEKDYYRSSPMFMVVGTK